MHKERATASYYKFGRKSGKCHIDKDPEPKFNFNLENKPCELLREMTAFLSDSDKLIMLLLETAVVLKSTARAASVNLYMVDSVAGEIYEVKRDNIREREAALKIRKGYTVATYVAFKKEYLMVDDILGDERFPSGVGSHADTIRSVLCVPIITPDGECYAIIELCRGVNQLPFNKNELRICIVVSGWMGAAIHQNHLRSAMQKQKELNDHLLDITKSYFAESYSIDSTITEIVKFAKATTNAERGIFFIIDEDSKEMAAEIFEEGICGDDDVMYKKNMEVNLSSTQTIAGLVARNQCTLNIKDTRADPSFISTIEKPVGFITKSLLSMPIISDKVLGIVQLANKINGQYFTDTDKYLFNTFSVYCALVLHYTRLHQKMFQTAMINECNVKLLRVHIKPCVHEMDALVRQPKVNLPYDFKEFRWYVTAGDVSIMPQLVLYMVIEIVGESELSIPNLMEYILTARKCYRKNYYHNFEHAFNVVHCMYNILRRNMSLFTKLELKALIIAALGHDLDHGGFTNNFLQLTDDTLAQLYEESPLENHHYQVTMLIMSNCNIFPNIDKKKFDIISREMKDAILATDLASYFKFRVKLLKIIDENSIDWKNHRHRTLIKSIMMTTSDLSGNCKPFLVAKALADNVYREFYHQGDLEKEMGLVPLSLMDRDKSANVPEDQVRFLTVIVLPCVELIKKVLPNTYEIYDLAIALRETWEEIVQRKDQTSWR